MNDIKLRGLFLDQLADILNADHQFTKVLARRARAANSVDLTAAFESHLAETEDHITRLEQIFTSLDVNR